MPRDSFSRDKGIITIGLFIFFFAVSYWRSGSIDAAIKATLVMIVVFIMLRIVLLR